MSDFKAKMHQIVCRLGLGPRSRWGLFTALPQAAYLDFRDLLLREWRGGEREETPALPLHPQPLHSR